MNRENNKIAHQFYALYETLPENIQQGFLKELIKKHANHLETVALYLDCQVTKKENKFLNETETQQFLKNLKTRADAN